MKSTGFQMANGCCGVMVRTENRPQSTALNPQWFSMFVQLVETGTVPEGKNCKYKWNISNIKSIFLRASGQFRFADASVFLSSALMFKTPPLSKLGFYLWETRPPLNLYLWLLVNHQQGCSKSTLKPTSLSADPQPRPSPGPDLPLTSVVF